MNRFLIAVLPIALIGGSFTASAETVSSPNNSGAPGCYTGDGCVNADFTQSTNGTTELDLNAIDRFIGPVAPVGNVYTYATGTSGGDAMWDWGFSILTQPNGVGSTHLSDYTYQITLHDVNNNTSLQFNPLLIPDDDWYGPNGKDNGVDSASLPANQLNTALGWGAQNYENFSFTGGAPAGFNPNADDTYWVTLTETSKATGLIDNTDSIVINAGAGSPTPEPGTFALAGLVLAGLGLARKKFLKA